MRLNKKDLMKTGVGVWLFNTSGQVLLGLQLSKHGFNTWSAPGGKPEALENIRNTAVRETWEETGIVIKPDMLQYVGITHDNFDDCYYQTLHYRVNDVCQTPIVREVDKCAKWVWFDLDKLPNNLFLPTRNLLNQKVFGV